MLKFASAPEIMGEQHKHIAYGPVTNAAGTLITDASLAAKLPSAPVNMGNWVAHDNNYWADNFDDLNERYIAWLAK